MSFQKIGTLTRIHGRFVRRASTPEWLQIMALNEASQPHGVVVSQQLGSAQDGDGGVRGIFSQNWGLPVRSK